MDCDAGRCQGGLVAMARTRSHGVSNDPPAALSAFSARRDANAITFANATFTVGTYDVEEFDDDGSFNHTTGVFTAPRGGLFVFSGALTATGLDIGERGIIGLFRNGASFKFGTTGFSSTADQDIASNVAAAVRLSTGDTVDLRLNQEEGLDRLQSLGLGYNWFSGVQIR